MSDRPERTGTDLANLIAQADERAGSDPKHGAILAFLQCLALRRAFCPRFGDEKHKPILEYDNREK